MLGIAGAVIFGPFAVERFAERRVKARRGRYVWLRYLGCCLP